MVNAKRVVNKLPLLLIEGNTSTSRNYNAYRKTDYRLRQFRRKQPERANALFNKLYAVLDEIQEAVS